MPRLTLNNALINYYEAIEFDSYYELVCIPVVHRHVDSLGPSPEEVAEYEQQLGLMPKIPQMQNIRFVPVPPWEVRQKTEFVRLVQVDLGAPMGYALYAERKGEPKPWSPTGVVVEMIGFLSEFITWLPLAASPEQRSAAE